MAEKIKTFWQKIDGTKRRISYYSLGLAAVIQEIPFLSKYALSLYVIGGLAGGADTIQKVVLPRLMVWLQKRKGV